LLRWKIEKTYDVFKNKLFEQKAWANGRSAHLCQAHFIALLYNCIAAPDTVGPSAWGHSCGLAPGPLFEASPD
ncbi:MAG: hypothetical protein ACREIA_05900, partial [Opitutaceae bacterium]